MSGEIEMINRRLTPEPDVTKPMIDQLLEKAMTEPGEKVGTRNLKVFSY